MKLNTTSKLCEYCPDGEFYSFSLDSCLPCGSSCNLLCGYQEKCFECSHEQFYDIDMSSCVNSCNSDIQIILNNTQSGNKAYCRGLDYYVNPDSIEVIEAGTKEYPYRSLSLVFVELLNYFSNTNYTVNIYVMESTNNYLQLNRNYLINIGRVNFLSYSDQEGAIKSANLILTDEEILLFSPKTQYHVLKNSDLNISLASDASPQALGLITKIIFVYKTELSFTNIKIMSKYSDEEVDYNFVYALGQNERTVNFTNVHSQTSGSILLSLDHIAVYLKNYLFDGYKASYFINIINLCVNNPMPFFGGGLHADNLTMFNSQEEIVQYSTGALVYLATGNASFNNIIVNSTYISFPIEYGLISAASFSRCNPDSDSFSEVIYTNSYITNPLNPHSKIISFIALAANYGVNYRPSRLYISNVTFEDINLHGYPFLWISSLTPAEIVVENILFRNITAFSPIFLMEYPNDYYLSNITFENINGTGSSYIFAPDAASFHLKGITIRNVQGADSLHSVFIYASCIDSDTLNSETINHSLDPSPSLNIDDLLVENSRLGLNTLIKLYNTLPGSFTLKNAVFSNLQVMEGHSLIGANYITGFNIQNITFVDISRDEQDSGQTSNFLITFNTYDFSTNGSFIFDQVNMANSSVPLYFINGLQDYSENNSQLIFSNISYHDCVLDLEQSLLYFKSLFSTSTFTITITDSKFYNLYFVRGGNVINFAHQISSQLLMKNTEFTNITAGQIRIESFVKQSNETTNVLFQNVTAHNINASYVSFVALDQGGRLQIQDSQFYGIYSTFRGSVLSSSFKGTRVEAVNTQFYNNSAFQGGVASIEQESYFQCTNCSFHSNFGVEAAVIFQVLNGYTRLNECKIFQNYALSKPFLEILESVNLSILNKCDIHGNKIVTATDILSQVSGQCSTLCFLPSEAYTSAVVSNLMTTLREDHSIFSIAYGNLRLENQTMIYNSDTITKSFESTLSVVQSKIYNTTSSKQPFVLASCTLNMENVTFEYITKGEEVALISTNIGSSVNLNNIVYQSSLGPFSQLTSSAVEINNLSVSSIVSQIAIVQVYSAIDTILSNVSIQNISGSLDSVISIEKSNVNLISYLQLKHLLYGGIYLKQVKMAKMESSTLFNLTYGLRIESSDIAEITKCIFKYLGDDNLQKGGALWLTQSNTTIINNDINNNRAIAGGAVNIQCKDAKNKEHCKVSLISNRFHNNSAVKMGGALYYDSWRPQNKLNSFLSNNASYGSDIASYPVRIVLKEKENLHMNLKNVGSGIKYPDNLTFSIIDYDEQEIENDNTSQIKISPVTPNATVKGIDYARVTKGVGIFENLRFIYKPGAEKIQYVVNSKSLDKPLLRTILGSYVADNLLTVDFRWCKPGEIIESNHSCRVCDQGAYSTIWNSTSCNKCMNNAVCAGGSQIELKKGYWRNSLNSTDIIRCPILDSCEGGYSESNEFPVQCSSGHTGFLCTTCTSSDNDEKYMRTGLYKCEKCPDPLYNTIRVLGFSIILLMFFIFLVIINIKKRNESQTSILLRILTNYFQLISLTPSYQFNYPESIYHAFNPIEKVGSSSESFLSFDCFFSDSNIVAFTPSTVIFKLFLSAILPAIAIVLIVLFWVGFSYTNFKWCQDTKRGITVTVICLLFLIHPTLTNLSLTMFQCTNVGDELSRMTIDMEIECFSSEHFKWAFSFGLPMLVVWVFALPAIVLIILIKERKNLERLYVRRYFLVLYQGLKPQAFYWEFINTLRKILIPLFNVLLSRSSRFYQVVVAIIILLFIFRLQQYIKPYKLEENNQIEILAVLAGIVTLFSSIIFLDSIDREDLRDSSIAKIFSIFFIIFINSYFILRWIHLFLSCLKSKNSALRAIRGALGCILMKNKSPKLPEIVEPDNHTLQKQPSKLKSSKPKTPRFKKKKLLRKRVPKQNLKRRYQNPQISNPSLSPVDLNSKSSFIPDMDSEGGFRYLPSTPVMRHPKKSRFYPDS
ncbi:unnamed protein product [Moneuplotes crassus]|uniref:Uncharacterized protein n=1 Tax=Euplotes crassus TaxID=5936 RepID=A0AAD1UN13_EUPCR|nr:unnamed protein product [Moneuplotes crassus]